MNTYVILRRRHWPTPEALHQSARISTRVGQDEMPGQVRWIRSYVLAEDDGTLGTVCIYQGTDHEAIREHARRAELPADEVIHVGDTVVVRSDP